MKTLLITTALVIFSAVSFVGSTSVGATESTGGPSTRNFNNPKFGGMRLDLCVTWGVNCGMPAALMFCQSKGMADAQSFVIAHNIGAVTPTKLIGTGQVCNQNFCDGFSKIVCKK